MKEATLKAKEAEVAEIQEKLQKSQSVMFLDYRGLTVSEVTELRNKMRAAGVEYKVIKNTMMRRAAQEAGVEGWTKFSKGPQRVAFGYEDPVAPAKILVDFIENAKKTQLKGGVLAGRAMSQAEIKDLASLPSKEQLLAKLMGSLNAPVTGLVMALSGIPRKLVYALNAIKEKKEA